MAEVLHAQPQLNTGGNNRAGVARGRAHAACMILVKQIAEFRNLPLVARRAEVGEVLGDNVHVGLLRLQTAGGDIE